MLTNYIVFCQSLLSLWNCKKEDASLEAECEPGIQQPIHFTDKCQFVEMQKCKFDANM